MTITLIRSQGALPLLFARLPRVIYTRRLL